METGICFEETLADLYKKDLSTWPSSGKKRIFRSREEKNVLLWWMPGVISMTELVLSVCWWYMVDGG